MSRPLVTVAFPCHQQQQYVRLALQSVLAQTYTPLQIVIADDASADGTYEIVRDEASRYSGPHRLALNRNAERKGIENYNQLMSMAEGEFIVVAHSDDLSVPERVERLVAAWQEKGVSLVSSNALEIDAAGRPLGAYVPPDQSFDLTLESFIAQGWQRALLGATLAWERAVFDQFGPLDRARSAVSTDWVLPFRALLLRGVAYVPEVLVHFRVHADSRGHRFLHHNAREPLAQQESLLANTTTQYVYLLQTLQQHLTRTTQPADRWRATQKALLQAVVRSAGQWTTVRNQLMTDGKRVHWLPAS